MCHWLGHVPLAWPVCHWLGLCGRSFDLHQRKDQTPAVKQTEGLEAIAKSFFQHKNILHDHLLK